MDFTYHLEKLSLCLKASARRLLCSNIFLSLLLLISAKCCWRLPVAVFSGVVHVTLSSFKACLVSLSADLINPSKRNANFLPPALNFSLTLATALRKACWVGHGLLLQED